MVGWLCWGLTSQSTIFQSCRDGAIASLVINQYFRGVKCLAQGHNTAAVGLEPRTSRSGVRHSTTEPPGPPENVSKCSKPTVLSMISGTCFFADSVKINNIWQTKHTWTMNVTFFLIHPTPAPTFYNGKKGTDPESLKITFCTGNYTYFIAWHLSGNITLITWYTGTQAAFCQKI